MPLGHGQGARRLVDAGDIKTISGQTVGQEASATADIEDAGARSALVGGEDLSDIGFLRYRDTTIAGKPVEVGRSGRSK